MATISRDTPCLAITVVARDRLPVFRTEALKAIVCQAMDEARKSGGFAVFAYVILPDHLHVVTDGARKPSDTLRFLKGIISHRVIEHLKRGGHNSSLQKLRLQTKARGHEYSLWQHHSNVVLLATENMFMQKVNYLHLNPVRAGLAERAEDYRWSSVRCWRGGILEDEPLRVDLDQIVWRIPR
ncbi:MAG: hypothetical protein ABSA70_06270 [Terriglobia bacterium]